MRLVALLVVCLLAGAEGSSRRVKSPSIKSVSFTAGPVLHEDKFEEGKFGREEIKGIKNLVEVFENDVYESINNRRDKLVDFLEEAQDKTTIKATLEGYSEGSINSVMRRLEAVRDLVIQVWDKEDASHLSSKRKAKEALELRIQKLADRDARLEQKLREEKEAIEKTRRNEARKREKRSGGRKGETTLHLDEDEDEYEY